MSPTSPSTMSFLITGTLLGLSAGFSPGPLMTLVISETLRHDIKAGIKVALAPIVTDLPLIIVSLLLYREITHFQTAVGLISLLGAMLLLHMGYKSLRTKGMDINLKASASDSLKRGLLVNLLNPYPYLFWFTVGAPAILNAWAQSLLSLIAYVGSFYFLLIGSKILAAVLTGKSKSFLSGKGYLLVMKGIGFALCFFAFSLIREGIKLTGFF